MEGVPPEKMAEIQTAMIEFVKAHDNVREASEEKEEKAEAAKVLMREFEVSEILLPDGAVKYSKRDKVGGVSKGLIKSAIEVFCEDPPAEFALLRDLNGAQLGDAICAHIYDSREKKGFTETITRTRRAD